MDRISINLLPPTLKQSKQFQQRKRLLIFGCAAILVALIAATTGLIITSVIQSRELSKEEAALSTLTSHANSLKEKEAAVAILRKRLATIKQISDKQYPQTDAFILMTSLISEGTQMQSFQIDQANKIALHGVSKDAASLQQFFDNLTDPKINEGKIEKTYISNLSRGTSPQLLFDLEITTKTKK